MTKNELFREVGNIDDKYIIEAEETKRSIIQNVVFRRSLATAACLVVCVGIYVSTQRTKMDSTAEYSAESDVQCNWAGESTMREEAQSSTENEIGIQSTVAGDRSESWMEDFENKQEVTSPEMDVSDSTNKELQGGMIREDFSEQDIPKLLSEYPNEYEALLQTDAFVVVHGVVKKGMERWESFYDNVKEGKQAYVEIVQFTEEGDAVITAVLFRGDYFYVLEDHSRDAWGKNAWVEYECGYLYLDIQEGITRVVLSDLELQEEEVSDAIRKQPEKFIELVQFSNY